MGLWIHSWGGTALFTTHSIKPRQQQPPAIKPRRHHHSCEFAGRWPKYQFAVTKRAGLFLWCFLADCTGWQASGLGKVWRDSTVWRRNVHRFLGATAWAETQAAFKTSPNGILTAPDYSLSSEWSPLTTSYTAVAMEKKKNQPTTALLKATPIPLQDCETELGVLFNQNSFHMLDFPVCTQPRILTYRTKPQFCIIQAVRSSSCQLRLAHGMTEHKKSGAFIYWAETANRFTLTSGSVPVPSTLSQQSSALQ